MTKEPMDNIFHRIEGHIKKQTYPSVIALSLLLVALVGIVDYLTGVRTKGQFGFSIFYAIPVSLAAWYAGRRSGVFVSLACAASWIAADFTAGHRYLNPFIPYWNAAVRLGFFLIIAVILSALRTEYERRLILTEKALRATDRRYRSYIELTGQLGWTTNADGEVTEDIPSWRKHTGQSFEEAKGRGWLEAIHPDDREDTARAWTEAVASKSAYEVEYRVRGDDGSYRHFMARGVPVLDYDGSIIEWIGTSIDITERKRYEEELREAKVAAEAASRAKSEFMANMSHEFKTPLNHIMGFSELLYASLEGEAKMKQRAYLSHVQESGKLLLDTINDVLYMTRLEMDRITVEEATFDMYLLIKEVSVELSPVVESSGLALEVEYPAEVPREFIADPGHIKRIITNLANNALKFTHEGHVRIKAECEGRTEKDAELRISVEDTGIGIPQDKTEHIFGKFTQVDSSITRHYGGLGLGLAISKKLVELMGGTIGVTSEVGRGSTFWFTLRLPLKTTTP